MFRQRTGTPGRVHRTPSTYTSSLGLARIRTDEEPPAVTKPDVRDLDLRRRAAQHHGLVRPVELIGLTRREPERHEHRIRLAVIPPPGPYVPLDTVIGADISLSAKQLMQPTRRQPLPRRAFDVLLKQLVQPSDEQAQLRLDLALADIGKLRGRGADRLADDLARNLQRSGNLPDRLLANKVFPSDPANRIHRQHPGYRPSRTTGRRVGHAAGWVPFRRCSPRSRVTLPRCFPA